MKVFPQVASHSVTNFNHNNIVSSKQIDLDSNGLLKWSPRDPENPKEWSNARRWYTTFASIIMVVNGSMASSSPSGCLESISKGLNVSTEVASLTVTLFLLGYVAGPCLWAPLSEYYGRRPVLYGTFTTYFAFTFLCARAPNIAALLVGRFLTGTFVSGAMINTPGIFADLWGPIERGKCMMLFTCAMQMGPAIGPLIAGFYQLEPELGWRWNFYQLIWVGGFSLLLMFTIPETLQSQVLKRKARKIRAAKIPGFEDVKAPVEVDPRTLFQIFKVALVRPWQILFDPISFLVAIYITVVYTLLYMLFTIFPIVFIEKRGWNSGVGGLPLLSICVGALIAGIYVFWDSVRQRKNIARGHVQCPEDSLSVAMVGGILFPIAMFWLAWTGEFNSVHWIWPTLAGVAISIAISVLFVGFLNYLSESYLLYAASAQAANTIVRSAVAAGAPLYTDHMFSALGVGPGGSLIGGVAILLAPIPFIFYKYGHKIRQRSKFAPTPEVPKPQVTDEEQAVQWNGSGIFEVESDEEKDEKDDKYHSASSSSESIDMV